MKRAFSIATAIVLTISMPTWAGARSPAPSQSEIRDGRIAYVRGSLEGITDIASMTKTGGRRLNLTKSARNELYVDVSPDGRMVAFTRFGRRGGDIYTVPISGGQVHRLTSDRVPDELPIWSPDSSQIAFVRYAGGEDPEIFVMDADGSDRTRITDNDQNDSDPRWSPDGSRLLYNGGNVDENTQDVFIVTLGETEILNVTEADVNDTFAEWSPDGSMIVYASYRGEQWDLYSVTSDGSVTTRLTTDPNDDYAARWSPDGTRLSYVNGRLEGALPRDRVHVMNLDSGQDISVSPARLDAFSTSWSPSGMSVVFIGQVGGEDGPNWEIFTAAADGSALTRLTHSKAMEFDPSWARR